MRKTIIITLLIISTMILTACSSQRVYDTFKHVDDQGWEKNDELTFCIPKMAESGYYTLELGLRLNNYYPFRNLQLAVIQTVYPSLETPTDMLTLDIADSQGKMNGSGVSLYQYSQMFRKYRLQENDSISVRIRHDMKREILPGVMDVGVIIRKSQ